MTGFMTVSEARKNLYKIVDECSDKGASFVLTKKGKAVRIIDESKFQELILNYRLASHPETLEIIKKAQKELSNNKKK